MVGVVDAGELPEEGYLFLALELLRGAPFADRLIPNRPLPPEEQIKGEEAWFAGPRSQELPIDSVVALG